MDGLKKKNQTKMCINKQINKYPQLQRHTATAVVLSDKFKIIKK